MLFLILASLGLMYVLFKPICILVGFIVFISLEALTVEYSEDFVAMLSIGIVIILYFSIVPILINRTINLAW